MRLAVIPARGGSKRIPGKNIREFHGKPIITWSIQAAYQSELFDRVIVSTDDDTIAAVAESAGAEVPFRRPPELSDDHATTLAVMQHAINWFTEHDEFPGQVCCIYATAPFVRAQDLQAGFDLLVKSEADYAFSVTTFPFPIQRALRREPDGRVALFEPRYEQVRSQDLEEAWHDAGQFYWGTGSAFHQRRPIMNGDSVGLPLPRERVQDIDTEEDWQLAELMFAALRERER